MPYKDPEKQKAYERNYRKKERAELKRLRAEKKQIDCSLKEKVGKEKE